MILVKLLSKTLYVIILFTSFHQCRDEISVNFITIMKFIFLSYVFLVHIIFKNFINRNRFLQSRGNPRLSSEFKFIFGNLFKWCMFIKDITHGVKKVLEGCINVIVLKF